MGAVMVITSSSLTLTKTIVDVQRESTHQAAFDEYLNRLFLDLPTDAKILLEVNNDGNLTLEIENPGTEFPAGTQQQLAETLWLSESRDRNGLTSLKLETSTAKEGDSNTREPITFSANLLTSLSSLRWELFHKPRNEWSPEWTHAMGRPTHVRFFYTLPGYSEEHSQLFWVPARRNP